MTSTFALLLNPSCGSHATQLIYTQLSHWAEHSRRDFTLKCCWLTDSSAAIDWIGFAYSWVVVWVDGLFWMPDVSHTHSVQDSGFASRGGCSINGTTGVCPLDQRENVLTHHLIFLILDISCNFCDERAVWTNCGSNWGKECSHGGDRSSSECIFGILVLV